MILSGYDATASAPGVPITWRYIAVSDMWGSMNIFQGVPLGGHGFGEVVNVTLTLGVRTERNKVRFV